MNRMLIAEGTKFLISHPATLFGFVLGGGVIASLTLFTG
jgi:hypothetical protein